LSAFFYKFDFDFHSSRSVSFEFEELILKYEDNFMLDLPSFFSKKQHDVLIGTLLGDGCLSTDQGETWNYRCLHSARQRQYLFHKYDLFKQYCKSPPNFEVGAGPKSQRIPRYYFNTRRSKDFKWYAEKFYKQVNKGTALHWVKTVPQDVESYLTPTSVAYWLMDDGDQKRKGRNNGIRQSTQGFQADECEILQQALIQKFNLKVTLQKAGLNINLRQQYRLYNIFKVFLYCKRSYISRNFTVYVV
jgi:LAGLIDADG DNA endonuclease family